MQKPPVVVVLGHIDHGKSTLIDYIRKANVTAKEAGGITQSIGAYQVSIGKDKSLTFIDTPGHEAFGAMRSHGARAADIALLVIAADEGAKPQTIEAIKDIKEAEIPFIVVLNKTDKPEANPRKVKEELVSHEVFVEGFGGDVPALEISAKTGKGVKALLDLIILMAEVEGLKADSAARATGVVIVSSLDSQKGVIATVIVKNGTLKTGQWIRLETTYGKVRAMRSFEGTFIKEAGPSSPVQILGLEHLPSVGEPFRVVASKEEAQAQILPAHETLSIEKLTAGQKALRVILKAKEKASLEALTKLFSQVQTQHPHITFQVISKHVGDVSVSDIDVADRFNALILGFNVKIPSIVRPALSQHDVKVKVFTVIYDLPKLIKEFVGEQFSPQAQAAQKSELAVLGVFSKSKEGQIIGGKVTNASIKKGMTLTISRNGAITGKGKIINLQQLKKDVSIVDAGKECGILFDGDEVKVGDTLMEA